MHHSETDYFVYQFAKIWGCTPDHSNDVVHAFFQSEHFRHGIPAIPGALESLLRLKDEMDLVVVTSRQHVIQEPTLEWLDHHFPSVFTSVHFGNHWAMSGESRSKSQICADVGAHVLVDDNPVYAMDCADAGLQVLLYDWNGGYPWSKLPEGFSHDNISVVRDWAHVERQLRQLAASR